MQHKIGDCMLWNLCKKWVNRDPIRRRSPLEARADAGLFIGPIDIWTAVLEIDKINYIPFDFFLIDYSAFQ